MRVPTIRAVRWVIAAGVWLGCVGWAAPPAHAKRPPLTQGGAIVAKRYYTLWLRYARGEVRVTRVRRRVAPKGSPKRILPIAGPFAVVLEDRAGKVLGRYEVSFALLGPGEPDPMIAKGLTTTTRVEVPHEKGLAMFRVVDRGGKTLATQRVGTAKRKRTRAR